MKSVFVSKLIKYTKTDVLQLVHHTEFHFDNWIWYISHLNGHSNTELLGFSSQSMLAANFIDLKETKDGSNLVQIWNRTRTIAKGVIRATQPL